MSYYGFPTYESVADKKANNLKALAKFQKKHPDANPIVIEGNKIATSFWGKAWCDNLQYYADFDNRIARGRSYIKNGAVIDLKISTGSITGVVCGSHSNTYKITVNIALIKDNRLIEKIGGNIEDLETLAQGEFPTALADVFLTKENGLFPTIKELKLNCSCPDYAQMCKHVSAVLYAVGAKLDHNPLLLFSLRGIQTAELIQKSIDDKLKLMLKNAEHSKSSRILKSKDIGKLFGLE